MVVAGAAGAESTVGGAERRGSDLQCGPMRDQSAECRSERIAFVGELFDPDDSGRLTARFAVHWEDNSGERMEQGPQGVGVEDAIEWGRRHAEVVQVRLGGEDVPFSAGEKQPPGETLPVWPPKGTTVRPRPAGAARDGSEQTIDWRVRTEVELESVDDELLRRLRAEVESAAAVVAVEDAARSRRGAALVYDITARGLADAVVDGDKIVQEATERVLTGGVDRARPRVATETTTWE
jgi:hypothetical protein